MSEKNRLLEYAKYNIWANELLVNWLKNQPDEVLDAVVPSSFPSLRKTFLHIWDAEQIWHKRLNGEVVIAFPSQTFTGNTNQLFDGFLTGSAKFLSFISDKTEDWLAETQEYKTMAAGTFLGVRADAIHHCMNHSTYHRGQIVTIARNLGIFQPPATDFMAWKRQF
jgi:uncharacterized damage-inducible protein DinB